jgi:hypothetical protein
MSQAVELLTTRPGFNLGEVHAGFVVDKLAMGHGFPQSVIIFAPYPRILAEVFPEFPQFWE